MFKFWQRFDTIIALEWGVFMANNYPKNNILFLRRVNMRVIYYY